MLSSVRSKGGACKFKHMCGNLGVCLYKKREKRMYVDVHWYIFGT